MEIEYDVVGHYFFCDGHVSNDEFILALMEQWETDYCMPMFHDPKTSIGPVKHTYARYVRGGMGYWKLTEVQTHGAKPVTVLNGSVVNLGPNRCPTCDYLMVLREASSFEMVEMETWECPNCRTSLEITRPR